MDGIPLPPSIGLGGDPLESILGPFPCARLRNLPHEATLEDVLLFFQGLVVLDVILQGNGEAYVIFANPMDFQMALQRYVLISVLFHHDASTMDLFGLIPSCCSPQ